MQLTKLGARVFNKQERGNADIDSSSFLADQQVRSGTFRVAGKRSGLVLELWYAVPDYRSLQ